MKAIFSGAIIGMLLLGIPMAFQPIEVCLAAGTIYVDDGSSYPGNGTLLWPYRHIWQSIENASEGDTIYVYSGTYAENIVIDKSLTITGEHRDTVLISGTETTKDTVTIQGNYLNYVSDVSLFGCTIEQNPTAKGKQFDVIYVEYTTGFEISNCLITGGYAGILTKKASEGSISENTIEDNNIGLWITQTSTNNLVTNNEIVDNTNKGLWFQDSSSGNTLYYNIFEANGQHAYDACTNQWDDGFEGNYWDDYTGVDESPEDGVGDTPYSVPGGGNQDRYPLGYFQGEEPSSNNKPTADAGGPYSGEVNSAITFDGSDSSDPDNDDLSYRWDWTNDGSYDTGWLTSATTTHTYTTAGTYTVKLQVKDNDGATDTDTAQVTITESDAKPTAEIITINPGETTYGTPIFFYGIAKNYQGTSISYHWRSTINGTLSTEQRFNTASLRVGTHTIYFKVQDSNGWSDEDSATVIINPDLSTPNQAPIADAGGPYTGHTNEELSFDASASYDPDEDNLNYSWDFGDGGMGYGESVTHIYQSSGEYTITLIVEDNQGKSNTTTVLASISATPSNQNGDDQGTNSIPGFEAVLLIFAIAVMFIKKKRKS